MHWIAFALLSSFFFATYNVFLKVASGHINQIVGAVILQVAAALVGLILLLILKINHVPFSVTEKGVLYAVLAGVSVGLSEIFAFFLFSKGITASVGVPIIVGGSVLIAALLSFFFLKEAILPLQYVGIALIVGGIYLLAR